MPKINLLSPHVADLIAAGEVVERPSSVIKELLENSIDAGARNITVEIRSGGMTYLRVTDDGCGMSPDDAGVAFLRHATSKLKDERGLEAIGTLGFRGEALAAISAVSRIELLTREKGSQDGIRVTLEAGDIQEMGPVGCPEGTTIIIRDLFYNTPARLKFMKSDRAEGANCVSTALYCALGRPEVSIRCIKDGKEEFFSPGDGRIDSCIYSLLGRDLAASMLDCISNDDSVSVRGFVSAPHAGRGNRANQYFFCNGRYIKSKTLQAALEQAYRNTLLTGRFPSCVIYIDLSFASVDVNVHPTKLEVKFSNEKQVFDCVYYAALSALSADNNTAKIRLSESTAMEPQKEPAIEKISSPGKPIIFKPTAPSGVSIPAYYSNTTVKETVADYQTSLPFVQEELPVNVSYKEFGFSAPVPMSQTVPKPVVVTVEPQFSSIPVHAKEHSAAEEIPLGPSFRVVGEALETYIIVEHGDAITLIDKHAAHERIIFDKLKAQSGELMSQSLLLPITYKPDSEALELIYENGELLTELGFEIEPYGEDTVVLRAVPADTDDDPAAMLEEILEKLRKGNTGLAGEARDHILHTIACKAAIKAGRNSEIAELSKLAARVMSGEIKYCPHGRPVSVVLTKKELDKQFKRIV